MTPDQSAQPRGIPAFQPRRRNPKTNAERQREFRERNPGYYGRLKAKQRAAEKVRFEVYVATKAILNAYRTIPLMLPAPVEPIEIPGVTTIPRRDAIPDRVMVGAISPSPGTPGEGRGEGLRRRAA
jgi:hypothetical protein